MVEFVISIPFQNFMHILAEFSTFSRSWKPILQFNTVWEPVCYITIAVCSYQTFSKFQPYK